MDPALLQSRRQICELSYGFRCACSSCSFLDSLGGIPDLPADPGVLSDLERDLRIFVGVNPSHVLDALPTRGIEGMPRSLLCLLSEQYLESLSKSFTESSHDGPYRLALDTGSTLLALYMVIYPTNYPQIGKSSQSQLRDSDLMPIPGMHSLELAKTAWNAVMTGSESPSGTRTSEEKALILLARSYLSMSSRILGVFGREGDDAGPLQEIQVLRELLDGVEAM